MATQTAPRPAARVRGQLDPTPRAAHPEWFAPAAEAKPPVLLPSTGRKPVSRAQVRLRRTVALLVLATVALFVVFALGRASVHAAQPGAQPTTATPVVVTVQPGETLWSIATRIAPNADPRATIRSIRELNGLSTGAVQAGQRIVLPR